MNTTIKHDSNDWTAELTKVDHMGILVARFKDPAGVTHGAFDFPIPEFLQAVRDELGGPAVDQGLPFAKGGVLPSPLTVADLSAKHIGKRIRVTSGTSSIVGVLHELAFEFSPIQRLCDLMPPVSGVEITMERSRVTWPLGTQVEVLP